MSDTPYAGRHIHFVTGRLAADALRDVVDKTAKKLGFSYSIGVMPITVAALMTSRWLLRHLQVPSNATDVLLPGYCDHDIASLQSLTHATIQCGPRDLRDLPRFFGEKNFFEDSYGKYSIEIIAEINHAPRLPLNTIIEQARALSKSGADVIDLGCDPAQTWSRVDECVRAVRDLGLRVSIDTFDPLEASLACRAGAELVLSVNHSNREAAADWGTEVVAIPDLPDEPDSLRATIEYLEQQGVRYRVDPILEPIGCGFTKSLKRYFDFRQSFPDVPMMMGVGNLSELTDVDSAGINVLLLSICEELSIHSVLTTQVINWARSSVAECDVARRLAWYANEHRVPPKHVDNRLIRLRDPRLNRYPPETLEQLSRSIRDYNFRIFAQDDRIHVIAAGIHLEHSDPFTLFAELQELSQVKNLDPSHAFYLGFEMSKALTALTLGKQYEQDEALQWGDLTRPERHHRLARTPRKPPTTPNP